MIEDKIYQYFERNDGLHVLFIFDPSGMKGEELAGVQWPDGYRYLAPKGSWFNIKYLIDRDWADDKVVLYFPQLSPVQLKQEFPLMDLLKANMEYHDQDYAAFMQQHRLKSDFSTYISNHVSELQSDKMLALLEPSYRDGTFNIDLANRAFISAYLDKTPRSIADWQTIIIRLIILADESEANKRAAFYKKLEQNLDAKKALEARLEKTFGCRLQANTAERVNQIVQKMKYNAIVQSLPVNPIDNYKHLRINDAFALQEINHIMEKGTTDPKRADAFRSVVRALAADIREDVLVNTYGLDADYWTVTPNMAWAILRSIMEDTVESEPQVALDRLGKLLMKCTQQSAIVDVVSFARFTAQYYELVKSVKTIKFNKPDEYVSRYCSEFYLLDYNYRNAVSSYYSIDNTVPPFASLERAKEALDTHYHKFINRLNLEWIDCLKSTGGFGLVSLSRQQDFYETYVKPMSVKVVVVVSDALRYEVAAQLTERLAALRHPAKLEAALAMLPTETCYCKTALLPHTSIGFAEAGKMLVDGDALTDTASRQKQLQKYRPKSMCKTFTEISQGTGLENREICKNDVVYIFHDTIDTGSHGNKPSKAVTDSCERAVDELAQLVKSLLSSWNATHVVITSDHGFLFNDIKFEEKDKQPVNEDVIENKTRYYITSSAAQQSNITKFPLNQVSAMDNDDLLVAVPVGTNRLYQKGGDYTFTHGGASLQEMIIPVIVSHRVDEEKRGSVGAMVLETNLRMTSSRVKFTILQTEAVSGTSKERNIVCAVYDGDEVVSQMLPMALNRGDASPEARKFPVELTLNKPTSSSVLQLRIFDIDDMLNPLVRTNITNNTLIERDEF